MVYTVRFENSGGSLIRSRSRVGKLEKAKVNSRKSEIIRLPRATPVFVACDDFIE